MDHPQTAFDRHVHETFLNRAIEISRDALSVPGATPFGALVVIGGEVVAEGMSLVIRKHDPTAHAEVQAIRAAALRMGNHLLEEATLYCSSEPCPLCLMACYWAEIPTVIFAALTTDVAEHGFQDLAYYQQLKLATSERSISEVTASEEFRINAVDVLDKWREIHGE
ncbi:MAG: nucleoside deaminase [Acidimicrobiaceae bacterium]|nr:nucleoside deaminase [Acidimicrobiaceae bacterium]